MTLYLWSIFPFVLALFNIIDAVAGLSTIISEDTTLPPDEWFEQKLDHFDSTSLFTWKQRYQTNDTFFDDPQTGPVFLMIGGEGEARPEWVYEGSMVTMYALKYRALCFQLEHRFYGKSHPTRDMSTDNLKYLTVEQALADLAYFIQGMSLKYGLTASNRWFVFGGSYPGSLAAWVRLKYPHLVYGAVSVSAPLLAVVDFKDFNKMIEELLGQQNLDCLFNTKLAMKIFNKLAKSTKGQDLITKKFNLCTKFNASNHDDALSLVDILSDYIVEAVQYNKDHRITIDPTANITVDDICEIMTNHSLGGPIDRFAALNELFLTQQNMDCLNFTYQYMTDQPRVDQWKDVQNDGARQWLYQTCTEFGYYQTSNSDQELFGATLDLPYYLKQCRDVFGEKFNEKTLHIGVHTTNTLYGQLDIDVSRVVFVQGSADPWRALGITKTRSWTSPAVFIEGAAHCALLYEPYPDDSPDLVAAREKISILLGYWLDYQPPNLDL